MTLRAHPWIPCGDSTWVRIDQFGSCVATVEPLSPGVRIFRWTVLGVPSNGVYASARECRSAADDRLQSVGYCLEQERSFDVVVEISERELHDLVRGHLQQRGIEPPGARYVRLVVVPGAPGFSLRVVYTVQERASEPAPVRGGRQWRGVLGLGHGPVTRAQVEAAYRRLARERHPDLGGSNAAMVELNAARDAALKEVVR